ncbi:MAG: hypothetical protein MUP11_03100, partial [Anaerolineales bacterium]|nr:hypothetical protein [Anaerolineales bacterium]
GRKMTVQISKIQIEKLGPINSLNFDFSQLNLVYGHNETGKTYLVEFLLQSLFRQSKNWNLRDMTDAGSVTLRGILPEEISFSPGGRKKLEDYWQEEDLGLPHNMARLLIVKGGELALASNAPGGINRDVLKTALTSQALLDQIRSSIPPVVQKASLIDQKIKGHNQGQIKELNQLFDDLKDLENLLYQIDEKYSQGTARQIEIQIDETRIKLEEQNAAKRHQAYLTWEKRSDLVAQKDIYADEKLNLLRDHLRDYGEHQQDLISLKDSYLKNQEISKDYVWLEAAIDVWENKNLDNKGKPNNIIGLTGFFILLAGIITLFIQYFLPSLELFWPGIASTILGIGISFFYGFRLMRWSNLIDDAGDRKAIQLDFEEKFNLKPRGLADIKAQRSMIQDAHLLAKKDQEQIQHKNSQLAKEKSAINNLFFDITGKQVKEKDWLKTIQELKTHSASIDKKINDLALTLGKLDIDQAEFLSEGGGLSYNPETVTALHMSLQDMETRLTESHSDLETLKARACERTRDEIIIPWPDVLYHLKQRFAEVHTAYQTLTAVTVAEIALTEILTKLQLEEDQKIKREINTKEVSDLLLSITGKYNKLDLVGDEVFIQDQYRTYSLKDLSTGAREQAQLALRLGIASRICGGEPLFLILDDAFQHSDWNRRKALVQNVIELVKSGWQVTYLTMDDHIRDLFLKSAKPALKSKFKFMELD